MNNVLTRKLKDDDVEDISSIHAAITQAPVKNEMIVINAPLEE